MIKNKNIGDHKNENIAGDPDNKTLYPVTTPFCSSGSSHWITF